MIAAGAEQLPLGERLAVAVTVVFPGEMPETVVGLPGEVTVAIPELAEFQVILPRVPPLEILETVAVIVLL